MDLPPPPLPGRNWRRGITNCSLRAPARTNRPRWRRVWWCACPATTDLSCLLDWSSFSYKNLYSRLNIDKFRQREIAQWTIPASAFLASFRPLKLFFFFFLPYIYIYTPFFILFLSHSPQGRKNPTGAAGKREEKNTTLFIIRYPAVDHWFQGKE